MPSHLVTRNDVGTRVDDALADILPRGRGRARVVGIAESLFGRRADGVVVRAEDAARIRRVELMADAAVLAPIDAVVAEPV
jgi:hypothetical protein